MESGHPPYVGKSRSDPRLVKRHRRLQISQRGSHRMVRLCQDFGEGRCVTRTAQQIALHGVTVIVSEELQLGGCFDAFGDHA